MPAAPDPTPTEPRSVLAPGAPSAAPRWFLAALGSWSGSWGMHQVLFAWLVVGELREDPTWVGTAQMFLNLPSIAFLLVGGVTADRLDRRRLLAAMHVAAALAAAGMAWIVHAGALALGVLLVYGLAWGTFQAFLGPARDALLSDVAGGEILRAVTWATLVQFVTQAVGARGAGLAEAFGSPALLVVQAGVLLAGLVPLARVRAGAGAAASLRTPPDTPARRSAASRPLAEIRAGLRAVWRSPRMRPVAFLVAANGLFFMGPFFTLCPLIVRDVHHGDVADLSLVLVVFPAGTVLGSLAQLWRGGVRRKGRALLLGLAGGGLSLAALGLPLPFWAFLAAIFVWGLCAATFLTMGRTLFQEAAPAELRGRVLSVYSAALLGMAPASNLGSGLLADAVGPAVGCVVCGAAMLLAIALAWVGTDVRGMT